MRRKRDRPTTWGLWGTFEPIVPRDLRLEVEERILADGTIDTKLDAVEVKNATEALPFLEKQCDVIDRFYQFLC